MFNTGFGQRNDMQAMAQQYWNAISDAMRASGGFNPQMPGANAWGDALSFWSRLNHGGRSDINDAMARFNEQARQWFAQMQQVAAQFSGQSADAKQIVDAWRKALGAASANPFPEMFRSMGANAMPGLGQWTEDASPWLDSMRREMDSVLSMPTFGLAREHQERLQQLMRAQLDYQETNAAFNALMAKSGQRAFEVFEQRLAAHEEPGRQITTARALFDVWVDAAEQAYAEIALTLEFREAYGALVNAQMRVRNGMQKEWELMCAQLGMPTRTEVDSAHRKIAELQRELRKLTRANQRGGNLPARAPARTVEDEAQAPTPARSEPAAAASQSSSVSQDSEASPAPAKKAAAPAKKAAAKKTPAKKAAVKKAPAKKAAAKTASATSAPAKQAPAKTASASSAPAKQAASKEDADKPAGSAAAAGSVAKKAAAKTSVTQKAAAKKAVTKQPAKAAKKASAKKAAKKSAVRKAPTGLLSGIPMPNAPTGKTNN